MTLYPEYILNYREILFELSKKYESREEIYIPHYIHGNIYFGIDLTKVCICAVNRPEALIKFYDFLSNNCFFTEEFKESSGYLLIHEHVKEFIEDYTSSEQEVPCSLMDIIYKAVEDFIEYEILNDLLWLEAVSQRSIVL